MLRICSQLPRAPELTMRLMVLSAGKLAFIAACTSSNKAEIIAKYEKQAQKVQSQFENGLVTDAERRQEQIKTPERVAQ
jgi:DNA-directed RNA polymerase subunit beta'